MEQALENITLRNGFTFSFPEVTAGSYIEYNGIRLTTIENGYARGEIDIRPELLNPNKVLHGGVLGTLADTVAIFGCVYAYEVPSVTTVNMTVSYLRPVNSGTVAAEATMLSEGKNISHWRVDITDGEGRQVAAAFVSYSIKR